ncbi:MAG: substrate-binding domain-containing protein [Cyanobacteria bacterium J06629_9]
MFKPRAALSLALLLTLSTAPAVVLKLAPAFAQASFTVPDTVPEDTQVTISSGSDSMTAISNGLKQGFEGAYAGSEISINAVGADIAIQDLLAGNADLAAISRPLTADEEAQGLVAVPYQRIKIAVVVSEDNAFNGNLSGNQFAGMFRGEVADWSEVGGEPGAIRFVDQPDVSDTRKALAPYPVFQEAPFATGVTTVQVSDPSAETVAAALGSDGIGYILFSEVGDLSGVRILSMHQTLPDDPRYPFSQPFSFVYKG